MSSAEINTGRETVDPRSPRLHDAAAVAVPSQASLPVLERPLSTQRQQVKWIYAGVVLGFHLLLPLAFLPYFFSWYGVLWLPLGNYIFCTMGIGAGYHRLLTHRGYQCPAWLEYTFSLLGLCCIQDTPARWVAVHRVHHNNSDEQPDPHSPLVTWFWGHMGWLFVENAEFGKLATFEKYTRDLMRQPFYRWIERRYNWLWILIAHAVIITGLGAMYGAIRYGDTATIVQCAAQWFIWGVVVRVIYTWHITWGVNSFAHMFGYRNYETNDNSRNCWYIGLATNGEGWHNNHHADPRSAIHGHQWWEIDLTYRSLWLLEKCGLVWNIIKPRVNNKLQIVPPVEGEETWKLS